MNFENIYQEYSPKIYRLCMGYVNDPDWAKDLVQETFISVWKNLSGFRKESGVGTWIYRIAVNNCLRQIERKKRSVGEDQLAQIPAPLPAEDNNEQLRFLRKCIAELKEVDRIIISMVLEEVAQKDIAEILGVSEGNVRVKVHRIKQSLSKKFTAHGQF